MRCLTRMGLGLLGLALIAPSVVRADPGPSDSSSPTQPHPRRALLRKPRLCAQCQWLELRGKGVNVPPPPPLPQGGATQRGNTCDRCGGAVARVANGEKNPLWTPVPLSAPAPIPGQPMRGTAMASNGGYCPQCNESHSATGYAVVGGEGGPGYAVIGGSTPLFEPTPIGVVRGPYAQPPTPTPNPALAMAGMTGPGGGYPPAYPNQAGAAGRPRGFKKAKTNDAAVMPTSYSNDPYLANEHNRPHVLSHLFGLDAFGHRRRDERERRDREGHAAIRYQAASDPITDLPSKMVYGK